MNAGLILAPLAHSRPAGYNRPMPGKSRITQVAIAAMALSAEEGERRFIPAFIRLAADYAYLGCNNEDIAQRLDVSISTFQKWTVEQPRLQRALLKARELGLSRVARGLHAAATGYKHKETRLLVVDGEVQRHDVVKHYPPNVNAAALLLVNRDPARWRDRKLADATVTLDLGELVREALARRGKVIEGTAVPVAEDE